MILEIDITKMKARKAELQSELEKLDSMINLAEMYGKPTAEPTPAPVPTIIPPVTPKPKPPKEDGQRGCTPGLRRAVTLALFTGPATLYDLSRALAWKPERVQQVVSSMFKAELVILEGNKLALTGEGKTQASWFQSHPDKLTYAPNGKGGPRTAGPLSKLLQGEK